MCTISVFPTQIKWCSLEKCSACIISILKLLFPKQNWNRKQGYILYIYISTHTSTLFFFFKPHFLPLGEQDMQLGQLQMFKKKPLKCLKKRKERELCLLNVYVSYARGCKSVLAVTLTLHCWFRKMTENNETFSAAGSARTTGLVSGTGMAQLHQVSHANVTTQLLQMGAIAQW